MIWRARSNCYVWIETDFEGERAAIVDHPAEVGHHIVTRPHLPGSCCSPAPVWRVSGLSEMIPREVVGGGRADIEGMSARAPAGVDEAIRGNAEANVRAA